MARYILYHKSDIKKKKIDVTYFFILQKYM